MSYLEFPLGSVERGTVVRVELRGYEADVYLFDSSNAAQFKRTGGARGIARHFGHSPISFVVPSRAAWSVFVVPIGGNVRAAVSLLRMAS